VTAAGRAPRAGALLLAAACVVFGCRESAPGGGRGGAATSATPPGAAGAGGAGAELVVPERRHHFGRVTQGDTLKHVFAARNGTSAVLSVEDTLEVLGCTATAVPAVLEPGANGKLEVACKANVPGPLRVSLPLRANERPAGELSLEAEVEPLLAFERSVVDLTLPFGDERSVEVRLLGTRAKEARLAPAAAPPPSMTASVLAGDAQRSEGVRVLARGDAVGTHVGSLRYATGLAQPREVSLSYVVKVTGTLAVLPTNPVLELGGKGPHRVVIKVTSTQPGFVVSRAEVLEGPFTARVRRAEGGFDVEVTAVESKLPPGARGVNGRLRIVSNDRTEGTKEVPLFGLGVPFGAPQRR
jgi:hypothetical protein